MDKSKQKIKSEKENINDEKSSKVLYNEIIRLYNLNENSSNITNEKANGVIVFNSAIITLIILTSAQILDINHFQNVQYLISLIFIPLAILMYSLKNALKAYAPNNYNDIDAEKLYNNLFNESNIEIMDQISANTQEDITLNKKILDQRIKNLKISMDYLIYGVLSLIICFGILFIVIAFYPQLHNLYFLLNP